MTWKSYDFAASVVFTVLIAFDMPCWGQPRTAELGPAKQENINKYISIMGRSRKDLIPPHGKNWNYPLPFSRHPTDYQHPPSWTSRLQIIPPPPLNILNSFILGLDL